ncbi:MAG: GNAT family N-acetyltransferase [Clostridiales bacterium]|nr:GNAT family N-acetyltransferase [Clostridiales bacterium]
MSTLHIRPITIEDTDNIVKWRNSRDVRENLFTQTELTAEQHLQWLQHYVYPGLCRQFIVEVEDDGIKTPIGTTFIKNIDVEKKTGEFGIFIGESAAKGRGYGSQATRHILTYAFDELKLRQVSLSVFSDNEGAVYIYRKLGFRTEEVQHMKFPGMRRSRTVLFMTLAREQWKKS